ncbi:hypothetical protein [Nocardioides sp.]|uniref:hypothetical protein n=1 Tax=Nocardioides sp. TaxID=35761 RepID=UPI001A22379A|nr:hypothetical protein [Nocardioides sp.]MBJ7358379.1 hypothetical protein [Nocardioides sp.]
MTLYAAEDRPVATATPWSRAHLEQLLSQFLAPACLERLWLETWGRLGVSPATLASWYRRFGEDCTALAVAAGLTEQQLTEHLADRAPDRQVLEMLADLNCYPHVTPAARPVTAAPWARHLR